MFVRGFREHGDQIDIAEARIEVPLIKDPRTYRPTREGPTMDRIASCTAPSTGAISESSGEGYSLTPQP